MQELAIYSFQVELNTAAAQARLQDIDRKVIDWLKEKGVHDTAAVEGKFASRSDDLGGEFFRKSIKSSSGLLEEIRLVESSNINQQFTTLISVTYDGAVVRVFSSLSVESLSNVVAPSPSYPRCPKVIRSLISSFDDWTFNGQLLPTEVAQEAKTDADVEFLSRKLKDVSRNLPCIVISNDQDEVVWSELATELARDLVGLAHVHAIDEEGAWILTDELGKKNSCYLGAVRLYWPSHHSNSDSIRGTVWTADTLKSTFGADRAGMNRFRSLVRGTVMSAAALAIAPPKTIRDIQNASIRERMGDAKSAERDKELDSIIDENSSLHDQLAEAKQKIHDLKSTLESLQFGVEQRSSALLEEPQDDASNFKKAVAGELRYYKKIGKKGDADDLVVTGSCNHNSWKAAFKAIQAEKGLLRVEGRRDWKSMHHCSTCKGGGRWRVQW